MGPAQLARVVGRRLYKGNICGPLLLRGSGGRWLAPPLLRVLLMSARDNHLLEVRLALPSHSSLSGPCLPALWARVGSLRFPTAGSPPPHVSSHIRTFTLFLSCKCLSFSLLPLRRAPESWTSSHPATCCGAFLTDFVLPPTHSCFISCYLLHNKHGPAEESSPDKHRDTSDCL